MDNLYITQLFDWDQPPTVKRRFVNRLISKLGYEAALVSPFQTGEMTTLEQRINIFHLLSQVLAFKVPGDVVEIGTHSGHSAALFSKVIDSFTPKRQLHVYDLFESPDESVLLDHFGKLGLNRPTFHKGWLNETLDELPDEVCFFHLDIGPGRSTPGMIEDLTFCLERLYPRMRPGAIGLLADYCNPAAYDQDGYHFPHVILSKRVWNPYPFIKDVCERFFADKPETMAPLFGGSYSHGYFRKVGG